LHPGPLDDAPGRLVACLGEPRFVSESTEQIDACHRPNYPARGATGPGARVDLPSALRGDLWEKRRAGSRLVRACKVLLECCDPDVWTFFQRLGFERREIGGIDDGDD